MVLRGEDDSGSHLSREDGVFGIIFVVTSGIWGTMDVDARSIPSG